MDAALQIVLAAAGMFWSIFWALVLGFGISGAVLAFVPRQRLTKLLGHPGIKQIALAMGLGAASSSCSYAAASMSRSLFSKGAHIVPSLAFLLASTNLVLELSLILWLLLGWQFLAAELIGGVLLVAYMSALMLLFGPLKEFEKARERKNQGPALELEAVASPRTLEGWREAAALAWGEWNMIWKDIALGMLISGVLMVLVPDSFWQSLFLAHGTESHALKLVENALVGPLVSAVSFVCSIGNIPLASVLYHGGIGFGGAVSFIFADLIIIPLVLVYRKYFGWKLALWITGIFYVSMALAGITVDLLFTLLGWIPPASVAHAHSMNHFQLNYTFWLNLVFLVLAAVSYWLARTKKTKHSSHCHHHG
jgi:uncharacterized membrane protein YraQ (UPF0718 family)